MAGAGVDGDPLQPFVVRWILEVARDAGVVGHRRQRTTAEFAPTGDVDADHRIGLLLNGMELAAIGIDGNPFKIVHADEEGFSDREPALQIQPEHRLGVITDGVQGAAVMVEGQTGGFVQPSRLVEDPVFLDQAQPQCGVGHGRPIAVSRIPGFAIAGGCWSTRAENG